MRRGPGGPLLSDGELVTAARQGHAPSLGLLLERHRPRLSATALRLIGYRPDAEDALQETMHLRTTIVSSAPRLQIERLHERVVSQNMVLGALRGIPRTSELILQVPDSIDAAHSTTLDAVTKRL